MICVEDMPQCVGNTHPELQENRSVACENNVCFCPNGRLAECTHHNSFACESCSPGYELVGSLCIEIEPECTCQYGVPATGQDCPSNGSIKCLSCYTDGYFLDGDSNCVPKTCSCDNGTPVSDGSCLDTTNKLCSSCLENYHLSVETITGNYAVTCQPDIVCLPTQHVIVNTDRSYSCANNVCLCEHGIGNTNCQNHLDFSCQSCYSGYTLNSDNNSCEEDPVCTCANGIAATGSDCLVSEEKCASCYYGFEVVNDICDTIVCQCDNGQPVSDGTCYDSSWNHCQTCNPGFHLKYDNPQAYFDGDVAGHFTSSCEPDKVCSCRFGQAATGDSFVTDGAEICTACHSPGFTLDSNNQCVKKQCACENGSGVNDGTCTDKLIQKCASCIDGFHLELGNAQTIQGIDSITIICVADLPECTGATHPEIHEDGSITCEDNECLCPNGQPVTGENCLVGW